MKSGFLQMSSRPRAKSAGFTLLELTIAMSFVAALVGGIALTVSTALKVWDRSQEIAEINQEARSVFEVLSRDLRGAYLGLTNNGGYFLGGVGSQHLNTSQSFEFTTESSSLTRLALLPPTDIEDWDLETEVLPPPVTDFVAVRYSVIEATPDMSPGLYRLTWAAPTPEWVEERRSESEAFRIELISPSVNSVRLWYFDGEEWLSAWTTDERNLRLPNAIAVELTLLDKQGNKHSYETICHVPAQ